jgi:tetratricopeptide (TPR) repeat protein
MLIVPMVVIAKAIHPAPQVAPPPVWQRPLIASDALAFYLGKVLWPVTHGIDYGRTPAKVIQSGQAYFTWLGPACVAIILFLLRRRIPLALAGAALAVAAVLPLLGLVPFDFQYISTVADRYFYVPMFGVALICSAVLSRWSVKWWIGPAALVMLAMSGWSIAEQRHWTDGMTVMKHAIEVNPNSSTAHNNLANEYLERDQPRRALSHAQLAVQLVPRNAPAHCALASAQWLSGQRAEAEATFRRGIAVDPNSSDLPAALAMILSEEGRLDEAIPLAQRSLELSPRLPMTRARLGHMLAEQGRLEDAAVQLEIAAATLPDPAVHVKLGNVLGRIGKPAEARAHLHEALRLDPRNKAAQSELEWLDRAYPPTTPK